MLDNKSINEIGIRFEIYPYEHILQGYDLFLEISEYLVKGCLKKWSKIIFQLKFKI